VKSRILQKDGRYIKAWQAKGKRKAPVGMAAFNSQDYLIGISEGRQSVETIPTSSAPSKKRALAGKER
jgi:hypothetical protein